MTLKGDLDFQLERFHKDAAVQDTLRVFYGKDGTGDILKQENIDAFADMVDQDTGGLGVGLVTADGGISVDGDEAVQETLLQRLILCQILTMFMTLQKGSATCAIFMHMHRCMGSRYTISHYLLFYCVYRWRFCCQGFRYFHPGHCRTGLDSLPAFRKDLCSEAID